MGTTRFSGPITAGNVPDTTGTTPGTIANVGSVILGQIDTSVTQTATAQATNIVVPAGSTIVSVELFVTTAWTGAATTLSIGTSATATELATAVAGGTIGRITVTPGTDATRTNNWLNVGTTDVIVYLLSANAGSGVGQLVVRYIQGSNG